MRDLCRPHGMEKLDATINTSMVSSGMAETKLIMWCIALGLLYADTINFSKINRNKRFQKF